MNSLPLLSFPSLLMFMDLDHMFDSSAPRTESYIIELFLVQKLFHNFDRAAHHFFLAFLYLLYLF